MKTNLDNELMSEFSLSAKKIKKLLKEDDNFKEIVEDYVFCKKELEKLSSKKSKDLIIKYSETLEDLKEELLARLQE